MLPTTLLAAFLPLLGHVLAQDGSLSGPTSSASAAGYSCDPSKCKLPDCNCASTDPPGGLKPVRGSKLNFDRQQRGRQKLPTRHGLGSPRA